jgi:hypothetical protein
MFHFTITKYNGPPVGKYTREKTTRNPELHLDTICISLDNILCKTKSKIKIQDLFLI